VTDPLAGIGELVQRATGIAARPARAAALRAAVRRAAPGVDPRTVLARVSDPGQDGELLDRLIDEVTTRETTFSRDRRQLDTIRWPDLLASARAAGSAAIRVWSAGCASGEEPYTLALLACEAFRPLAPPVEVLGTDISGAALAAAAAGRYGERAVRALAGPERARYLDRGADSSFLAGQRLRRLVRFRRHNLALDPLPPAGEAAFDLVVCRNVLIYFDQPLASRVIEALRQSVRAGGRLMLGAADALQLTVARPGTGLAAGAGPGRGGPVESGPAASPPAARRAPGRAERLAAGERPPRAEQLAAALAAAGHGDREAALTQVASVLAADPLDAEAHFVGGLVTLEAGEPARAAAALRRALYADPAFTIAAFALGRAYDALGDRAAARRAFGQALRTLDPGDRRHEAILAQVDLGDIAAACRARLGRGQGTSEITDAGSGLR
jgi:chemotaxis protein methyltransferase CheR